MPHPSNLPRRATNISPATVYLHDWHGETPPGGIDFITTQPVQPGDRVAILELRNGNWRLIASPDNFVDLSRMEGRNVGRVVAIERLCNKIWIYTLTQILWRSFDNGVSWEIDPILPETSSGIDTNYMAYDVSGRLWLFTGVINGDLEIYKSNSGNGDDWEFIYTTGPNFFTSVGNEFSTDRAIVCHPEDPNIVAFAAVNFEGGGGFDLPYAFITTDGGNSFTQILLPFQDFIEFPPEAWGIYDMLFTKSGRLIVMFENFENEEPFENRFFADYTDDYETFVLNELLPEVRTGHFGFQGHLATSGNLVFAAFTRDHDENFSPTGFDGLICHIAKSTDNGSTYEEFVRFTQPTNEIVDMPGYPQGLVYDPDNKLLYVFFTSFGFDADGLTHDPGLFIQTVDDSGQKAIATELIQASGLTIPYPLFITATPQKGISPSVDIVNRPRGRLAGNVSNLPGGEVLCH